MTLSELRNSMAPEDVIKILEKYNVKPFYIGSNYIIFPTCCHNLTGGKNKLYYYFDSHLFICYTECNSSFDIFELIMKMEKLRGNIQITLYEALKISGINTREVLSTDTTKSQNAIDYMYDFTRAIYKIKQNETVDERVLNASIFETNVLSIWEQEGISLSTMRQYKIGYNPIDNCITIPIYDDCGNLISVRGRFLSDDAEAKYKPVTFCNKTLSAPSSQLLYGLYQTKEAIKESKTAIIFESEKSVLMMDSYYGKQNNSVATLGKNISNQHILLLQKYGADNIILAYDADYRNAKELKIKLKEYTKIAKTLAPFFSVSIIIDWDKQLPYKASPIDCGPKVFEKLLEKKHYVKF